MILFIALQNNLIRKALGLLVFGLLVTAASLSGCSKKKESAGSATATQNLSSPQSATQSPLVQAERTVDKALARNIDLLLSVEGVLKAEVGDLNGKPCIRVFVTKKLPELERNVPRFIKGYPVVVDETTGEAVSGTK